MKNILLPLDYYSDPRRVLKDLLAFLQGVEGHCNLFLLDTYMVPYSSSNEVIPTHDERRRQSIEKLHDLLDGAQELSTNGKVSFEIISQMGTPVNVVARIIQEKGIDCVVFGTNEGRSGDPKQDEITKLLNRLHCPIVVLPLAVATQGVK
jgi:hypothetical protein